MISPVSNDSFTTSTLSSRKTVVESLRDKPFDPREIYLNQVIAVIMAVLKLWTEQKYIYLENERLSVFKESTITQWECFLRLIKCKNAIWTVANGPTLYRDVIDTLMVSNTFWVVEAFYLYMVIKDVIYV